MVIGVEFVCFMFCRKGDYYRYLAEFKTGNERKEVADQSMKAYEVRLMKTLCIQSIFHCSAVLL